VARVISGADPRRLDEDVAVPDLRADDLPARSYLYVPGDDAARLAKAESRGADAIIMDVEDGVAPARKDEALHTVAGALAGAATGVQRWVRLEPLRVADDTAVIVGPHLAGIVLPKADAESVRALSDLLDGCERRAGLTLGGIRILPLVETAGALRRLDALAAAPRVLRLGMGEADLRAELGLEPGPAEVELLPLRSAVVVASAAAGLTAPVGSTTTQFRDLEAVRESALRLRALGFRARTAIHPAQVAVVNDVFSPSEEQVAAALEVVRAFDEAVAAGRGAVTGPDGRMLDLAVVRSAREVLGRSTLGRG
jgi:citrate lyase subunit beta/citryl-CoA lyase